MEKQKIKSIVSITEELHNDITSIYEDLMDEDDTQALTSIDETIDKLRHLKSNLVIKDN